MLSSFLEGGQQRWKQNTFPFFLFVCLFNKVWAVSCWADSLSHVAYFACKFKRPLRREMVAILLHFWRRCLSLSLIGSSISRIIIQLADAGFSLQTGIQRPESVAFSIFFFFLSFDGPTRATPPSLPLVDDDYYEFRHVTQGGNSILRIPLHSKSPPLDAVLLALTLIFVDFNTDTVIRQRIAALNNWQAKQFTRFFYFLFKIFQLFFFKNLLFLFLSGFYISLAISLEIFYFIHLIFHSPLQWFYNYSQSSDYIAGWFRSPRRRWQAFAGLAIYTSGMWNQQSIEQANDRPLAPILLLY